MSTALEWMVVSYYVSPGNGNQVLLKSKEQVLSTDKPAFQLLKSAFKKKTFFRILNKENENLNKKPICPTLNSSFTFTGPK